MKFMSANYMRFLTHTMKSKKIAEQLANKLSFEDKLVMLHSRLINEVYIEIENAASEGRYCAKIRPTHLLWQTPSVQGYFGSKGFELNHQTNTIQWCKSGELK